MGFAVIWAIASVGFFGYLIYDQKTRVAPNMNRYPPPVANKLRRALYFTEIKLEPVRALNEYKEALKVAIEMGLHPFSDEVVGIKIQVAGMLETAGLIKPSIDVLERTKKDSLQWIELSRKRAATEQINVAEEARKRKRALAEVAGQVTGAIHITDEDIVEIRKKIEEFAEFEERQRDRILKKVVGIQLKLGDLYASDYIQDDKKAEEAQVAAVELCLKELMRRQSLGLPVGIGESADSEAWLSLTEMGAAFVELASRYNEKGRYNLALPLYLRALDLIRLDEGDSPSCRQVDLLNGISTAMAGQAQMLQPPRSPEKQGPPGQETASREYFINAAKQWAQKSLDVASTIKPPVRDELCDTSCVAATYNLGELAELAGQRDEASRRYKEAESLAQAIGFDDGVSVAREALKRIR